MDPAAVAAARQAMIDKRFAGNASGAKTGGSGSMRMKAKGSHKSGGGECKSLLSCSGRAWLLARRGWRVWISAGGRALLFAAHAFELAASACTVHRPAAAQRACQSPPPRAVHSNPAPPSPAVDACPSSILSCRPRKTNPSPFPPPRPSRRGPQAERRAEEDAAHGN